LFLRAFRDSPQGPPVERWPSPEVLRRWMRRRVFRLAMQNVRDTFRFQADLHLSAAAARAAALLQEGIAATDLAQVDAEKLQHAVARIHALVQLLRLSHLRTRFTFDPPPPPPRGIDLYKALQRVHQDLPVGRALELMDLMMNRDSAPEPGNGQAK
jgi:hypothetical protein